MNALTLLLNSFIFVANQNMFYLAMGLTTSIAMFVGASIYNGNFEQAKKGVFAVGSYGTMLAWTIFSRVLPNAIERNFVYSDGRAFAGLVTIIYVTIFWMLGIGMGVTVYKWTKKKSV